MKLTPPGVDEDETPDEEDGCADDTGVLALRLEQLREPSWVEPVLASALAQMAPSLTEIGRYDIEYCKIKPNRDINLVARVELGVERGR